MPWRRIFYFVGLAIGLTLFIRQVWIGYGSLQNHQFVLVHPGYLWGALACYVAGYLVQILAWSVIMRALCAPLALPQAFQGYLLSFLPRYIPGTIWGYLSRNEWLAQHCGIGYATSSLASILEASTLLLSVCLFAVIYLIASPWKLLAALVCIGLLWLNWWVVPRLARYLSKGRWQIQVNDQHFIWLWLVGNLLYLLFWSIEGAALLLIGRALGTLNDATLLTGAFSASTAWAIGFLVLFVPTGLGVREATLSTLLTRFTQTLAGQAGTIAILSRLVLICAELLLVLFALPWHFLRPQTEHKPIKR
ncbi:MAG: lysylphosphatidylglycerol synthase domain-containing protein, partial [Chloroflexi bacterium]|nr:lysylphosphatidylglycerol synthase domain-containing protein [Chloroflexota bacterium]